MSLAVGVQPEMLYNVIMGIGKQDIGGGVDKWKGKQTVMRNRREKI